jgi:hypothetical protein
MAKTAWQLRQDRELLCSRIADNLDILIGSVSTKGPRRPGHNLTFKLEGVTRSRHIRVADLRRVRLMTARHKKLKGLIQQISDLNWKILCLESE